MRKFFSRIAASFVALTFLFTQYPALAQELVNSSASKVNSTTFAEPEILGEVVEKREECIKHFRMSDGSMVAVVYSEPVHYKDGDTFKEIDNSLTENGDVYQNTESSFKVRLSKNSEDKKIATLNSESHEVSWSYIKKNRKLKVDHKRALGEKVAEAQTVAEVENEKWKKEITNNYQPQAAEIENFKIKARTFANKRQEKTDVSKISSKAKYKNADPEVDFDYSLSGLGLKENIIINNRLDFSENDSFDFEFKTNDLKIEKDKNGNLNFTDGSEKIIYSMPKGSMWDSGEGYSGDVNYEFEEIDGGYIISVIPNHDWINSVDRLFPIIIDPSITTKIETGIQDVQVGSSDPNQNYENNDNITSGKTSSSIWKTYVKCTELPNLTHGEIITKAQLKLKSFPTSYAYVGSPDNKLGIKKPIDSWDQSTITWNNHPDNDGVIYDYLTTSSETMGQWHNWDVTKLIKDWYQLDNPNDNTGVEVSSITDDLSLLRFISSKNAVYPNDKPYFEISYRNFIGEEPYWSYTNHGAGLKGFGKVNNYAGTLSVSENVLSYSGTRNPLSIINTYNNSNYNNHANETVHLQNFPNGYPHSSSTGLGFTLDFNRIVYELSSEDLMTLAVENKLDYRYLYIDSDGTWHYFYLKDGKIIDEDGLGFEIIGITDGLEISDKGGNKLTFKKPFGSDVCYALNSSQDSDKNTTNYYYEKEPNTPNSKINRITDATGRETLISYGQNGMVSEITEADGRKTKFEYDEEKLIEIVYPDKLKTGYGYDQLGRLERVWTNAGTGSCVVYKYASNSAKSTNFFKIRSVTEFGSTDASRGTEGNSVHFDYEMNQTKVIYRTSNLDVNYHENTEIWQFDHDGRVTCAMDENGNMITNQYVNNKEYPRNLYSFKVKHSNDTSKYTNNLLKNSGGASNDMNDWKFKNFHTGEIFTLENSPIIMSGEDKNFGEKSFKLTNNNNSSWPVAEQKVSVSKSNKTRKYTLSADVKIVGELSDGNGASLHLAAFDGDVQLSGDEYSRWLYTTDNDWRRINVTVDAPAGTDSIKCYFGVKESSGTAYFDCLQLEEGESPSDYNIVENSSFDDGFENWGKYNLESSDVVENGRLKISGNPNLSKACYQDIIVNKDNAVLAISAYAQGLAVPHNENATKYHIGCKLFFEDGYQCFAKNIPFSPSIKDIQRAYGSVVANDYHPGIKLASIRVEVDFNQNCNTVYFDNIQVCVDDHGASYDRDSKADITKIVDNICKDTNIERTDHHEARSITLPNGDVTTNIYDDEENFDNSQKSLDELWPHRLISSTSPITNNRKVKAGLTYDNYGNVLTSKFSNEDISQNINSEIEYTSSGNYASKSKDSRGKITTFTHNENNGNLNSVTNSKNVTTNYTYDIDNRVTSTSCENAQTDYVYSNGVLSKLFHKISDEAQVGYNFIRDIFGKITQTKVGNQVLTTNTYDSGNGLLNQVKYNNNQITRYNHDKFGRMIKAQHLKGKEKSEFEYTYDNKSRLVGTFDSENDLTTKFEYDLYGRLAHIRRSDGVSNDIKYNGLVQNLVDKVTSKMFGISQITENTFGASNMLEKSKITTGENSVWQKYSYDSLGRTELIETLNEEETSEIKHEISYVDVNGSDTTNLVNSIEAKKNSNETLSKFSYEYDDVGNITDIKGQNDNLIVHYEYDNLNQLKRENNVSTGKSIVYTYDLGGNIQKKEIFAYTTGDLSSETPENTVTYGYSDSNWKDKLTSYNGENIIYDGVGNPTNYRNGLKFEWTRGRRLGKASKTGYNMEYKYDDGGIRTEKTINGVTTKFVTNGIQVLAQKTGDEKIIWQLDGNGSISGFNHNGTQYFYIKNAQNDIVGITDESGNIVANYTYDSWGKLVSITNSGGENVTENSSHIGYINPLRYRSYYYDTETELYYLNARYYDPETGRFINSDDNLSDFNLFRYCHNDPVNKFDPEGMYDRKAAHLYAITWWEKNNSEYPDFGNNGDCANFVSQCLKAGGFETNDQWYCKRKTDLGSKVVGVIKPYKKWDYSNSWSCAYEQYNYFKNSDLINGEVIISSNDEITSVVNADKDRVRMGDIMYLQWDKDHPHHATIITSIRDNMIYYNAHTDPADDKALSKFFEKYPEGKAFILKIK